MPTNIKVLFLSANPKTVSRVDVEEEMRTIEQKVRASEHRDDLTFQAAPAARPDDLLQLLNQHRPHVVHFTGNGSEEGLSFIGDDGQARLVRNETLSSLFRVMKDNIHLIFLDACYSPMQAQALAGTIDCVIVMKENLSDKARIAFASSFYRALGFGRSIHNAFEQSRISLQLEGLSGNDAPQLLCKEGIDPQQIFLISPQNP